MAWLQTLTRRVGSGNLAPALMSLWKPVNEVWSAQKVPGLEERLEGLHSKARLTSRQPRVGLLGRRCGV